MTELEERLRRDLPRLADAILDGDALDSPSPGDRTEYGDITDLSSQRPPGTSSRSHRLVAIAAALIVLVGLGYTGVRAVRTDDDVTVTAAAKPIDFGTWDTISIAPISPRAFAVTGWIDPHVVFWAGSNLSRGLAYTDGALYDPDGDSWSSLEVPGWGHPGLTSAVFDGELVALAKGSGTRIDPGEGDWTPLPRVEGMYLASTVATNDSVWGIGPAATDDAGQPDLAIARYEPEGETWEYGPVFEGTSEQAGVVTGLSRGESTALWSGSEIVIWGNENGGIAFDPQDQSWRTVVLVPPPSGIIRRSTAIAHEGGVAVIAEVESSDGPAVDVALLGDSGWRWLDTSIPVARFETITAAAADAWIMLLSGDESPALLHLPSGAWQRPEVSPLGGVEGPSVTWTGRELVIWGGVPADESSATGAKWVPPLHS